MKSQAELKLEAKVRAINSVHKYATELHPVLVKFFTPYIGQTILKQDGSLLKKIVEKLPEFLHNNASGLMVYFYRSSYSLVWMVKACENIPEYGTCVYYEVGVYVGNLDGAVLKDFIAPFTGRSDYTAAEIQQKRITLEDAKKAEREAKSALGPFEEHDY